jgi:hypothetical protein
VIKTKKIKRFAKKMRTSNEAEIKNKRIKIFVKRTRILYEEETRS